MICVDLCIINTEIYLQMIEMDVIFLEAAIALEHQQKEIQHLDIADTHQLMFQRVGQLKELLVSPSIKTRMTSPSRDHVIFLLLISGVTLIAHLGKHVRNSRVTIFLLIFAIIRTMLKPERATIALLMAPMVLGVGWMIMATLSQQRAISLLSLSTKLKYERVLSFILMHNGR